MLVVVAHPNEIVKKGLEKALSENPSVHRVWGADGLDLALSISAGRSDTPAVLLVARSLAGDGSRLRAAGYAGKVLLLLDEAEESALGALNWADGFLDEHTLTEDALTEALERIARDEVPMPPATARSPLAHAAPRPVWPRARQLLTRREQETLQLVVDGLSNKEIARHLSIGVNGVKRHVSNVLAKLNCANRTKAAAYAIHSGLVANRRDS
ncbi:DNA-binding NarL/FixJ family response regulator [Crossiella equi]|uniref:DNA-binding NarL/FixJ family response regulator n=1 Tax=Crossiella equi TaxID=130796 RepID=A0ABS5AJC1_9PSEU|nr:response regulator transcription factor [Crossiella equi]MBP2476656.1 DNA-binding NarL/FixJ family response regulator [Crossiella equi]